MTESQQFSKPLLKQLARLARLERWYMTELDKPTTTLYVELCQILDKYSPGWDDGSVSKPKKGVS